MCKVTKYHTAECRWWMKNSWDFVLHCFPIPPSLSPPLLSTPLSAIIPVPAAWSAWHHNYYILYVRLYTVQCKASKQKEQLRFGQLTMLTLSGIANFSDHLLFLTFVVFCKSASGIAQSRTRVEMCGQMRPLEQLGRVSPTNHDRIQNHLIHFSSKIISRQLK